MGSNKGIVKFRKQECTVTMAPGGAVWADDGIAFFDGIDCWPAPSMVGLPLRVPDDGEWYTVSLCRDESYLCWFKVLPGLCWDYDHDKVSLAAVRRWPDSEKVQIEDRREYLKYAVTAIG